MKKIHLKYSFLLLCFMVALMLFAKVQIETNVKQSATQFLDQASEKENEYRYYLQIFRIFNAQ